MAADPITGKLGAYDCPIIPHGHSVPANAQLTAAFPASTIPLVEYLVKWNQVNQLFFKQPVVPQDGVIRLSDAPGIGVDLDEAKIAERRELRWD